MSLDYIINFPDSTLRSPIVLKYGTVNNTATSLQLFGKGAGGYGIGLQEDLLSLLTHFNSGTAPRNPNVGQIWFDAGAQQVKVYTQAARWLGISGGSIPSSTTSPTNPVIGQLWYNLNTAAVEVYTQAARWLGISGGSIPSSTTSPTNPVIGQLWYNLNTAAVEVYNGISWAAISIGGGTNGNIDGGMYVGTADGGYFYGNPYQTPDLLAGLLLGGSYYGNPYQTPDPTAAVLDGGVI